MGARVNLKNRTVENIGDEDLVLVELITKTTTIAPGDKVTLDPTTKAIEF